MMKKNKFNRMKPVSDRANAIIASIAKKVAIEEMRALCTAMVEHNDFDINHYEQRVFDTSSADGKSFSVAFDFRYYGGKKAATEEWVSSGGKNGGDPGPEPRTYVRPDSRDCTGDGDGNFSGAGFDDGAGYGDGPSYGWGNSDGAGNSGGAGNGFGAV